MFRLPLVRGILLSVLLLTIVAGCTDSTSPGAHLPYGIAEFRVTVDLVSKTLTVDEVDPLEPGSPPLPVKLSASSLDLDWSQPRVNLFWKNAGGATLYAPASLVIHDVDAGAQLYLPHPDGKVCSPDAPRPHGTGCAFEFDYSYNMGFEPSLDSGHFVGGRTLDFRIDRGVDRFAFGVTVSMGLEPPRSTIKGRVFHDENGNGRPDQGENSLFYRDLVFDGPGFFDEGSLTLPPGQEEFTLFVRGPGVHTLSARPSTREMRALTPSTPSPRRITLSTTPGGYPESYEGVELGLTADSTVPQVVIWGQPGEPTPGATYSVRDPEVSGAMLELKVSYWGDHQDHGFTLYQVGQLFWPPGADYQEARLVLIHDDRGDTGDSYQPQSLRFDLTPVVDLAPRTHTPPKILLRLTDWRGRVHLCTLGYTE